MPRKGQRRIYES